MYRVKKPLIGLADATRRKMKTKALPCRVTREAGRDALRALEDPPPARVATAARRLRRARRVPLLPSCRTTRHWRCVSSGHHQTVATASVAREPASRGSRVPVVWRQHRAPSFGWVRMKAKASTQTRNKEGIKPIHGRGLYRQSTSRFGRGPGTSAPKSQKARL